MRDKHPLPSRITLSHLCSDDLMIPVLQDDAFIMCLDDLPEPENQPIPFFSSSWSSSRRQDQAEDVTQLLRRNAEFQEELEELKRDFSLYRAHVARTLDKVWGMDGDDGVDEVDDKEVAGGAGEGELVRAMVGGASAGMVTKGSKKTRRSQKEPSLRDIMDKEMGEEAENENGYFQSYAGLGKMFLPPAFSHHASLIPAPYLPSLPIILFPVSMKHQKRLAVLTLQEKKKKKKDIHEVMLKDTTRTESYLTFIYSHKTSLFSGKTILDVGCGTGILSLFAARAGAKKVIAVEQSSIAKSARQNVARNGFSDVVVVLQGKMEEVSLPDGIDQVDVIVSEWMGYCLTYEAMLPSVLWARDRYLKPGGHMVPSHATLRLAPVSGTAYVENSIDWWADVYGFDMSGLPAPRREHVVVTTLDAENLAGEAVAFRTFDLHQITAADLEFESQFTTSLTKKVDRFEGWAVWFDVFFAGDRAEDVKEKDEPAWWMATGVDRVAFTTGPAGARTHWEQGLLLVGEEEDEGGSEEQKADLVKPGEKHRYNQGDELRGTITFNHSTGNKRHLDISMAWDETTSVAGGKSTRKRTQKWLLG